MVFKILSIILISINFFGITNIPNTILLLILLLIGYTKLKTKTPFTVPIYLMFIGIILSFIPAFFFRNQTILETFKASVNFFYIIFFFSLIKMQPSLKQTEKTIKYFAIIASIIYITQFFLLQKDIIFLPLPENSIEQGENVRFRILASGIFSLGYFYALNKYLILKKKEFLLIMFLCFTPILLQAFRTMIVFIFLLTIIMLFVVYSNNKLQILKYIIIAFLLCILIMQIPIFADKLTYMLEKQSTGEETFSNHDYIRWISFKYYTTDYFKSSWEYIFGSGSAYVDSNFGKQEYATAQNGIFWVDWGIIGAIWIVGPITVFSLLWFAIKTSFLRKNKTNIYIGIWYIYLIFSSITTIEFLRPGNFIIHALALYTAYKANQEYIKPLKTHNL